MCENLQHQRYRNQRLPFQIRGFQILHGGLLRIEQVEGASPRVGFRPVDLSAIAESVADAYEPDAGDGPRASADDITKLTHRFYRAEHSRSTLGNGLGLSLVAAGAQLHGAELQLASSGQGFRPALFFQSVVGGVRSATPDAATTNR